LEEMESLAGQGVKGLRLGPMLRPDIAWYNTLKSDRVWEKAGELGLVITLLVIPEQLAAAHQAIQRFPDVAVVIDHLARPDRAISPVDIENLFAMAALDQVYIKVSALGFMSRQPYPHPDILSIVRRAYDCFGPRRLMWGTDTPMSQKPEDIPAALKLIEMAIPGASVEDLDWIKGRTAEKLFGWL
jgi:L-fuconolactonase